MKLIIAYKRIIINVFEENEKKNIIQLTNVIYILNFMTNIVSSTILENKKIYIDSENRRLYREDKTIIIFIRIDDHYLLKNNIKINHFLLALMSWHRVHPPIQCAKRACDPAKTAESP